MTRNRQPVLRISPGQSGHASPVATSPASWVSPRRSVNVAAAISASRLLAGCPVPAAVPAALVGDLALFAVVADAAAAPAPASAGAAAMRACQAAARVSARLGLGQPGLLPCGRLVPGSAQALEVGDVMLVPGGPPGPDARLVAGQRVGVGVALQAAAVAAGRQLVPQPVVVHAARRGA